MTDAEKAANLLIPPVLTNDGGTADHPWLVKAAQGTFKMSDDDYAFHARTKGVTARVLGSLFGSSTSFIERINSLERSSGGLLWFAKDDRVAFVHYPATLSTHIFVEQKYALNKTAHRYVKRLIKDIQQAQRIK